MAATVHRCDLYCSVCVNRTDNLCWSYQLITFFFINQYFNGSRYIKQNFQVCWPHCSEITWPTWHLKSPAYTKWSLISLSSRHSNANDVTGFILGRSSANHRSRYIVTLSLIGWAHTQSDQRNWPSSYSAPAIISYKTCHNNGLITHVNTTKYGNILVVYVVVSKLGIGKGKKFSITRMQVSFGKARIQTQVSLETLGFESWRIL